MDELCSYRRSCDEILPGNGAVHLWVIALQATEDARNRLAKTLAPSEVARAKSFHFRRERERYIVGRGILRCILGRYLRVTAASVAFDYGMNGKPALAAPFIESGLHFNLAHCEDLALLALARRGVGVDVERIRTLEDAAEMTALCCSPNEQRQFESLKDGERDASFLRLWTRKEAWLKATGEGMCHSLRDVEVSFGPDETAKIIKLPAAAKPEAREWALQDLTVAGFVAAIALPEQIKEIRQQQWKEDSGRHEFN
jgi:4'-phosphopantetheinyl transferase